MKRLTRFSLVFVLLLLTSVTLAAPPVVNSAIPTHIIVFHSNIRAASVATSFAASYELNITNVYEEALNGIAAVVPNHQLKALSSDARVAYIERNGRVSIAAQSLPTGIRRVYAPNNTNLDIDGKDDFRVNADIAVIDTGISKHADLNLVGHVNCVAADPLQKKCVVGGADGNGHGTHVAGTAAALDNGIGVVGVAPGARLWGVRVLGNDGYGYWNWVIAGIDWVTKNASVIDVANMSLSGYGSVASVKTAISTAVGKGIVFTVAAGNESDNAANYTPASHPDVITVSALADFNGKPGGGAPSTCSFDTDDTLADFSNFGNVIDIAAPGVCIRSTLPGGGYGFFSGTSMASPHAAGAAAIIIATSGKPTTKAQALAVRNKMVSAGNLNWTDDSGDGKKERLLDLRNTTIYNP